MGTELPFLSWVVQETTKTTSRDNLTRDPPSHAVSCSSTFFFFFHKRVVSFLVVGPPTYLARSQYKRTSFIVLSIGAVVALSAVMMGGHSLYSFMFPNPDEEGAGGFCSVGE